jgi:hypothetical protein
VSFGCSAPVGAAPSGEGPAVEGTASSAALVLVERTVSTGAGDSARAEAVARFIRMRAGSIDEEALRMVGATVDFPAAGTCAPLTTLSTRTTQAPENEPARAVELVDVGSVSVEANGVSLSLPPRRLPDILELVSGVVYSTRAPDAESFPTEAPYVLRVSGRPNLSNGVPSSMETDPGPFVVSAVAPASLGDSDTLQIGGHDAKTSGAIVLSSDAPIDVVWTAGNPEDIVYIDVTSANSSVSPGSHASRCVFGDTGRAVLPPGVLALGEGTLGVHRLHREFFQARGIDSGEIRFDFARVLAFRR